MFLHICSIKKYLVMTRLLYTFFLLLFSLGFHQKSNAQCVIADLTATVSDCDGGSFYVIIDFEFAGVGNDGFKVQGNGQNYGIFSYDDLPVTIGPLPGNGTTNYEFVARDLAHPDCSDFAVVGPVFCGVGDCVIYDLLADPGDCLADGTYNLWINFQHENAPNTHFDVIYQGVNIGYFPLSELPVMIPHFQDNGAAFPAIHVCINDTPDCCAVTEFEAPNCPGGECDIYDLTVTASDCEAGMFYVTLDFEYENVGNAGFKVQGGGIVYGTFAYDDLPITLGPLAGNGTTFYEFAVKDVQHPGCSAGIGFGTVNCPSTGDCQVTELEVTPGDCWSDGTYPISINFDVANTTNNFFKVLYNGQVIAHNKPIASLPLIIEHFQDNGEAFPVVTVCINDQPGCCAEVEFEAPDCPASGNCHIFEVFAEAHPCDNGHFLLDVVFQHENTGSEGFTIKANGQVLGQFDYGQNFYTVGPLASGVVYEIVVRDNQFGDCKGFYQFGPVYCDGDCHIYDLTAVTSDCDDEGQFYVTLDFEHTGTTGDQFKVFGNGNVYGFFGYDDLPVTLGPFQTPLDNLEFVVADVPHPDCHDFVVVEAPNCNGGGGDCHISELTADVHPCLDNGTFFVTLDFNHENTSGYFKIQGNGVNYGIFSYDDLPVSIGPLVGNGSTNYGFIVRDLHFHDCAADIGIGTVECAGSGDCQIVDLVADAGDCHNDETYNIWVNFDFENATNNFYDVFHNGEFVDYYPLSHIPTVIPHVSGNGEPVQTVTVCINDNPNCCATFEYEAPDCEDQLVVWPGDANADNIANHFDLLNLGLAFGIEGPARSVQGIEWTGLAASNWNHAFSNLLNMKHADCNGNGKVNAADLEALLGNYGETHGTVETPVFIGGSENDPPFYVDLPAASAMSPGMQFTAPIMLGTEGNSVQNLYGIAFTLKFDPEIIDPASLQLMYDPSWLGVKGVNLLTVDKTFANEGVVQMALVRTDQNNVSGYGQVAAIIGIIDNIAGKETVSIEIRNVRAIRENEVLVPLSRPVEVVNLVNGTRETSENDKLNVFPNPAGQSVFITHEDGLQIESLELRNLNGQVVIFEKTQTNRLDIGRLAAGVYTLKAKAGDQFFIKKVVKI
jgi:hypothetical protein